jgi:hypothetical protein
MKQNITLAIDKQLVKKARALAAQRGTSVSAVDRIKFYTNQRESQWLGGTGGGPEQVLKIPPGGHFAGFVGRSGDSLDAIGLLYTGARPASAK